jgi:outer membrane lipoprotein-sorting protein
MKRLFFVLALLCSTTSVFATNNDNVTTILTKVRDRYDGKDYISDVTLRIYDNNKYQDKKMYMFQKDYDDKEMTSLFFFAPADVRNVSFLIMNYNESLAKDDDQWMYLPAFRKIRRISGQDKRGSFMGSTYNYSDLDKIRVKDFKSVLVGEEKIMGRDTWKIERTPVSQEVINKNGYNNTIVWVDKNTYLVVKQVFFDAKGVKFKELLAEDIQLQQNIWTIMRSKMTNLENGKVSEMHFNSIKYNVGVDDRYLSQNILKTGIKESDVSQLKGE